MTSRNAVRVLLLAVVGMPILQAVLFWVSGLLTAMGDESAAGVLRHIGTAAAVLWLAGIVGLVVAVAVRVLQDDSSQGPPHEQQ
ncbi:MAG: hypothetical protein AAGA92_06810 [Planctomycetota bacterium]